MMSTSILILIVAKALPSIQKQISSIHFTRISAIILIISGLLSLNTLYIQSIGSGIGIYSGLFQITNISQTIELFLFTIGSIILIGWPNFTSEATQTNNNLQIESISLGNLNKAKDYSIIVLFSILGSSLLISSLDLISFYLSLELQSFGLYILATLYKDSEASTNAGLKYFLLGGLSSCLILLGLGLIYSNTGLTNLESIYMLILTTNIQYVIIGTIFGIILIVIGLLFKISAAPLHNWSPDVYDETPTIVTIWLTIVPKISLLILLLEIYSPLSTDFIIALQPLAINLDWLISINNEIDGGAIIKNIFLISSILSLIIGTVVGLAQIKIKRLLAYSTISHIGFMLLALAINTEQSIDSFLFYLIQYIITNLNIFLILLAISYYYFNNIQVLPMQGEKDVKYITDLQGLFYANPFLSLSLSLSLFSMAGIPPFVGFFSKQFVLYSALDSGYYFISLLGIIVSVISATYYLKIIKILHSQKEGLNMQVINTNKVQGLPMQGENNLSQFHSLIISILSLFILLFILKPTLILNSTQVLSLTLFKL
ncbi:NADH dehydrogenase subunit 2 (mitochondrion) [Coprinopsis cinerea okayama7|jgi:NADH-ubiquinone oxidoreductase chain 2|uniref:NADH-ubiquinone oxidoreductase chain 2 n=1 Tax=Coprinopsis cinerea (strain Okayama-7 / 130 / ATCC MYA-4618 / FGSC 9003) TaxID=240176 RepID=D6RR53_COPC7|nr:NADH dehydrogenase subunit 2 [Coprinopsis cinerea okayama7\|eukprot:XP_022234936.1 NADH dehydrogenase subunit 2 (mitochondrion) [Coprinopsis cinerea okayama7\